MHVKSSTVFKQLALYCRNMKQVVLVALGKQWWLRWPAIACSSTEIVQLKTPISCLQNRGLHEVCLLAHLLDETHCLALVD